MVRVDDGRSKVAESSAENMDEVSYPISMLLHPSGLQYPNTPKLTPRKVPSGMALMIGVDRTEINKSANATKSSTAKGVAGLNIAIPN